MSRSHILKLERVVIRNARFFMNTRRTGLPGPIERAAVSLCASVEALDYAKFLEKKPNESGGSES
jgi:hypothetical protein